MMRLTALVLCVSALIGTVVPSAIPMWEFLKKEEKISYIYSLFANEVEEYCLSVPEDRNCNQDLLKFGLKKLKELSEEELDELDPYQRDAGYLIWDTLLNGLIAYKAPLKKSTTTPKPNSYDDNLSFGVTDDLDPQSEASAVVESYYPEGVMYVPRTGSNYVIDVGYPQYVEPQSFDHVPAESVYAVNTFEVADKPSGKLQSEKSFENVYPKKSGNAVNTFDASGKPSGKVQSEVPFENIYPKKSNSNRAKYGDDLESSWDAPKATLTGPSVVRVYPDGSPVTDHAPKVAQDEDLYQYRLHKLKLPVF